MARILRNLCILAWAGTTSGCLITHGNWLLQEPVIWAKNRHAAHAAWEARMGFLGEEIVYSPHFKEFEHGWKRGYFDIANGGDGCRPALPPRKYWSAAYQSPDGNARVQHWFEGYDQGVVAADEDGVGHFAHVPSTVAPQGAGPRQGGIPTEALPNEMREAVPLPVPDQTDMPLMDPESGMADETPNSVPETTTDSNQVPFLLPEQGGSPQESVTSERPADQEPAFPGQDTPAPPSEPLFEEDDERIPLFDYPSKSQQESTEDRAPNVAQSPRTGVKTSSMKRTAIAFSPSRNGQETLNKNADFAQGGPAFPDANETDQPPIEMAEGGGPSHARTSTMPESPKHDEPAQSVAVGQRRRPLSSQPRQATLAILARDVDDKHEEAEASRAEKIPTELPEKTPSGGNLPASAIIEAAHYEPDSIGGERPQRGQRRKGDSRPADGSKDGWHLFGFEPPQGAVTGGYKVAKKHVPPVGKRTSAYLKDGRTKRERSVSGDVFQGLSRLTSTSRSD